MANCVKIKLNEKVTRLRSSTLTVENLAMIFKLDVNQRINICCEEEGELIISQTGVFNVADYANSYVVNGVDKWRKIVQAERAFHFAPFFDNCQSRRPNREANFRF